MRYVSKFDKLFFAGGQNTSLSSKKILSISKKNFFLHIFVLEMPYVARACLGEKTRFPNTLEQMVATRVKNDAKLFLQL